MQRLKLELTNERNKAAICPVGAKNYAKQKQFTCIPSLETCISELKKEGTGLGGRDKI